MRYREQSEQLSQQWQRVLQFAGVGLVLVVANHALKQHGNEAGTLVTDVAAIFTAILCGASKK